MLKRIRTLGGVAALVAATAGFAAGCGSSNNPAAGDATAGAASTDSDKPIRIGAAAARTGFMVSYDQPDLDAFKIAMDEVNEAGGVKGRKVELIEQDSQSTADGAKKAATDLIDKGVDIMLVTSNYDVGSPAALAAESAGLLNISLGAASPRFGPQGVGPLAFTPAPATYYEGAAMAQLAKNRGWAKPFLLKDTSLDYSSEQCDGFADHAKKIGLQSVGQASFKNADKSIASQITKIKASGANAIAFCSYTPGGAVALRQLRAAGVDVPAMSGIGMGGTYWLDAVPRLSNYYTVSSASIFGDDPDPKVNAFVEKFEEVTGEAPLTDAVVGGYSIGEMVFKAIEATGTTEGAALAKHLETFKDEPLLMGPTTYTPTTHVINGRPFKLIKYENGKASFDSMLEVSGTVDLRLG